ncbi:MAG: hypothetical protein BMS9Abin34_133 [Patescibacteria group bacterium]|nr:MAG: hypothetical protein BMS9Abin34_133 [Patescibacteria group bacterium]
MGKETGPFDKHTLLPHFSYLPHDGWVKLLFALMIGLILGGFLFLGYLLLVW